MMRNGVIGSTADSDSVSRGSSPLSVVIDAEYFVEDRSKATIDDAVEFAKESKVADGSIAFQDNYAD